LDGRVSEGGFEEVECRVDEWFEEVDEDRRCMGMVLTEGMVDGVTDLVSHFGSRGFLFSLHTSLYSEMTVLGTVWRVIFWELYGGFHHGLQASVFTLKY
jgi:hypothetical protein